MCSRGPRAARACVSTLAHTPVPRPRPRPALTFLSRPVPPPPLSPPSPHSYTTLLSLPSGASVRKIGQTTWVTATSPPGTPLEAARSSGFSANFAYIAAHGYAMTAPVLTRVADDGSVRVSFLLPASAAVAPADGSAQGVVVETLPAQTVVVKPFKGAAVVPTTWDALAAAARPLATEAATAQVALSAAVPAAPEAGKATDETAAAVGPGVWLAGYSSPMTPPADKYSEVWLPVAAGASIPGVAP